MQYFKDLPVVSYQRSEGGRCDFEIEGKVVPPKGAELEPEVVFLGRMGNTLYLSIGTLVQCDIFPAKPPDRNQSFTRLTIKGMCISYSKGG